MTLTAPLPFFHHGPSTRALYIAAGPCPFVFSIAIKDVGGHAPVMAVGTTTHPFGRATAVASLADAGVRRELADSTPLKAGVMAASLASWANFCDAVSERLNEGDDLAAALGDTWVIQDGDDLDVDH